MLKKLAFVGLGAMVVAPLGGCDEEMLAKLAPGAEKMVTESYGFGAGDRLMDQYQTQDRLRDATSPNCMSPSGPETCDDSGPYGTGGHGYDDDGNGTGSSGGDRLQDGSCGG